MTSVDLRLGDSLAVLPTLDTASVDAIVTDPPYGLEFMGRAWDDAVPGVDIWAECLRVLKPGGHLLAFGGTRTVHRLACAIEDAGFEIRDQISWLYGSGFPKSLDVGKAIDKRGGNAHLADQIGDAIKAARTARGWTTGQADRHFCGGSTNWTWYEGRKGVCRPPTPADFGRIAEEWPELASWAEKVEEAEREVVGEARHNRNTRPTMYTAGGQVFETAPATAEAARWSGWGTALKPAQEPIIVARKPLAGTVAATVLAYGTGAINVDGTRVNPGTPVRDGGGWAAHKVERSEGWDRPYANGAEKTQAHDAGRWPANVVLIHGEQCVDGGACVDGCPVAELDAQSGPLHTQNPATRNKRRNTGWSPAGVERKVVDKAECNVGGHDEKGTGASRFYPVFRYQAKAPAAERPKIDGKSWPTVKPLSLMRWLVRLVTPPGGLVLDPFAGTGATLQAARDEGFRAIGVERDPFAYRLACQRLAGGDPLTRDLPA